MSKKIKYTVDQLNEMAHTTPSKLLLIAVEDMRALRKKKNIEFFMGDWVQTRIYREGKKEKKVCAVCMAGATLNRQFGAETYDDVCCISGERYGGAPEFAGAIDNMRCGNLPDEISSSLTDEELEVVSLKFQKMIDSTYRENRDRAELRTYERAAKFLASKGL
jgi:hypothetical protein